MADYIKAFAGYLEMERNASGNTIASYVLAFRGLETAEGITTTIFTACVGYLVTYAAKSATEKISRNRHGLDADGNPIEQHNDNMEG